MFHAITTEIYTVNVLLFIVEILKADSLPRLVLLHKLRLHLQASYVVA